MFGWVQYAEDLQPLGCDAHDLIPAFAMLRSFSVCRMGFRISNLCRHSSLLSRISQSSCVILVKKHAQVASCRCGI
jgi:hypothetical protein